MLSLDEVADRLASLPAPKGFSPEAFGFFQTLWALYPSFAGQWIEVLPAAVPDPTSSLRPEVGEPLLRSEDIRFDALPILQLWEHLVHRFEPLEGAGTDPVHSSRAFFTSRPDDSGPAVLIGGCLLRPFLYMAARKASSVIDLDGWIGGTCPVCGGAAYHGLIENRARKRILACGKCHFMWPFPRIRCPFCNNTNQDLLGFYRDDEEPRVRIDFCRACDRLLPVTVQEEGAGFPLLVYDHLVANHLQSIVWRRGS